ncbi:MFS transporter [Mucisphaera sp.]|uniref:MFS transporter n=1 Tax=Mucisphaera sp. TaxID=2913024 RepID=UPI003D0B21C1
MQRPAAGLGSDRGRAAELNRQLRWVLVAWLFGSWWLWTIQGSAITIFGLALGMPDWAFGVCGALVFLGPLAQLPASLFIETVGHRRLFFLVSLTVGRAMWVLIGLLPWILPGLEEWWWPIYLVLFGISRLTMDAGVPAWMNWMSDVIPRRIRGTYFGQRQRWALVPAIAATFLVGWLLEWTESNAADYLLAVTSGVIVFAGVMGVLDILCFLPVPDPGPKHREANPTPVRSLFLPLLDPQFRYYLGFSFFFNIGMGLMGGYAFHYGIEILGWSALKLNILILGIPFILKFWIMHLWGPVVDRMGNKPVMVIGMILLLPGSLNWLLMTPESIWPGYVLVLLVNVGWTALEVASFNFLVDMSGNRKQRDGQPRQRAGSAYPAINALCVSLGGMIGGFLGAFYAYEYADLYWVAPVTGSIITFHAVVFLMVLLTRVIGLLFVMQLKEPRAKGTREAMVFTSSVFYSNIRAGVMAPTRIAGRILSASYKQRR